MCPVRRERRILSVGVIPTRIGEVTLPDPYSDRPWGKGDNPKTAVWEYLKDHPEFEIDHRIEHKLLITSAPDGFLKRVR